VGLGVWRVDARRHYKNPHQLKEQGWMIQRSPSYRGASVRIQVIVAQQKNRPVEAELHTGHASPRYAARSTALQGGWGAD